MATYGPLSRTPTELLEKIFSLLPQLSDVFALAATCHRLRQVWTTSTNTIYRQVAPRCIPCEPYARSFLADQGGPAQESPLLSPEDLRRLIRNSWAVEKSITEFERKIVCKVRSMLSISEGLSRVDENYSDISNSRTLGCGEGLRDGIRRASREPNVHDSFDRTISFGVLWKWVLLNGSQDSKLCH